jgi:hypothetical protein
MYFVYVYENRIMKPAENFLRRGKGWEGIMEGVNLIKIYCKHLCKCHSVSLQLMYANKKLMNPWWFCLQVLEPVMEV